MQKHQFSAQACRNFVRSTFVASVLPSLQQFIRIPNVSKEFYLQDQWITNGWPLLQRAANHIANWIKSLEIKGCKVEILQNKSQNKTPIILTEVQATEGIGSYKDTYLFYGHYDKQPPLTGKWTIGEAYVPTITYDKDGNPQKLYGRGGADDGYSTYGTLLAIKALQQQNVPHPRCVMITEGDEESGTGDVEYWVQKIKERLGVPKLIVCLDSGTIDYDRLWITTSLRGVCSIILKIEVLEQAIHSGDASGIIPSSFRILQLLLQRIEDVKTGLMSDFDVEIPADRYKQLVELAELKGQGALRPNKTVSTNANGLGRPNESILQTLLLNGWRTQLAVTGIQGYPNPNDGSNVMLPYTRVKLSIRIPPTANENQTLQRIVKLLTTDVPYGAKVTCIPSETNASAGFNSPSFSAELEQIFRDASKRYFGGEKLTIAQGGSIPFLKFLQEQWTPSPQFLVTGVLGPEANAHGPNEFLHIPYLQNLICAVAEIIAKNTEIDFKI